LLNSENNKIKIRAAYLSFGIGIILFFGKITAYLLTDSKAIFSDAAESVIHVMATLMALYSIILSSKPPDKTHLYGHGNIEYFSAGIEGLLILIAAITIIYTSVLALIKTPVLNKLDIGVIIIAAAGIINLLLGFYLIKQGKKTSSLALEADGKHVLTDSITSIGVVVGLAIVLLTDLYFLDPLIAIIVALNILFTGYKLIRESVGGLMKETDKQLLEKISNKLIEIKKSQWIDIHQLRFWKSADRVFIDFHLRLPYYFTIKESHMEEEEIGEQLSGILPNLQVNVHMDYCDYNLCTFCNFSDCTVREKEFTHPTKWSTEKIIGPPIRKFGSD